MANSIEEYSNFIVMEQQVAQREFLTCQQHATVMKFFDDFQKQKFTAVIDSYYDHKYEFLEVCPHLAVLFFFMSMIQSQRIFEAMTEIRQLKEDPKLPANMFATLSGYLSLQNGMPVDAKVSPDSVLEKVKKDQSQILPTIAMIQALVQKGDDPNDFNMVFRYILGTPSVSAVNRYQLLEFLTVVNSTVKIYGDFEFRYRDEPARTITIGDDTVSKYDPLVVAAETFVARIDGLKEIVKSGLNNFLTLYHYANYGKSFPFRSSEEMEIFIFYALEKLSETVGADVSILSLEAISGYQTAESIRREVDKYLYYIGTDR